MSKTTITILYWGIFAPALVIGLTILFIKLRDRIINYGKTTARKYMEKYDPDLEDQNELDELEGLNDMDDEGK